MLALAGRSDVAWERVDWLWGDERCVAPGDSLSNVRLARESLLIPRGVPAGRIHAPPLELRDPDRVAAAYALRPVASASVKPSAPWPILSHRLP